MAILHAAQSHLDSLDKLQRNFIRELGLSEEEAFLAHHLAPLELRRDISALGLLHKIQLGEIHADFHGLFPKVVNEVVTQPRHGSKRHRRQFHEIIGNSYYFNQSLFGMTKIYNVLPEYAVMTSSVSAFQKVLTKDAKVACQKKRGDWQKMYNSRNYSWR